MQMHMGGDWSDSSSGDLREIRDPATLEIIDTVPEGNKTDVGFAIDAAEDAFPDWSKLPARERGRILGEAARRTRENSDDLAVLLSREQGKPLAEAKGEILGYVNVLEYYQSISGSLQGSLVDVPSIGPAIVQKRPFGPCGAIIPWNVPALTMAWKIAPALVTGNTMVLKPAPTTPLTNLHLASILAESGLPKGVLNIVTGEAIPVGREIVQSHKIKKISFTGSTEAGKDVATRAGGSLKKINLELGGSDPAIVCSDVDIETAAKGIVASRYYNCGQACTSLKRLYVIDDIADRLEKRVCELVSELKVGRGTEPGVQIGPLHSLKQKTEMLKQLKKGLEDKRVKTLIGGKAPDIGLPGHFFLPTVLSGVPEDSALVSEEVFAPILPIIRVGDLNEALYLANKGRYGLGASIWSNDIRNIRKAIDILETGRVWVNMHMRVPVELPFTGTKDSGVGSENGLQALDENLWTRTVMFGP